MSNTVYVDGDSLAYPTEGEVGWASPGSQFPTLVQRALDKLGLGQTLNSKAVIDIQSTTKGVLFPRMTTTERDAIGSPPNGLLVFNTTDQQFQYYDTVDVAWIPIGVSSGGTADPNYILFPVALKDPLTTPNYPWRLYNDSAAVPVDGTGGTAAITLVRNTTTPLNPLGDFEVAKAGVSAQGSGFSTDFTIDRRHLGRVLQVSFDAMLKGGTYTAGAIRVYLIQDPTGTPVVIEPVNTTLQLGLSDVKVKHIASFQTPIDVTSYRLCIHVYGSDTNSWTISYTNFKVWEPIANYGAIITDWQSYIPTTQGIGVISNSSLRWRRVGSNLEIRGNFRTGTTSADEFRLGFPNGYVANTPTTASDDVEVCGYLARDVLDNLSNLVILAKNNRNYVTIGHIASDISRNPFVALNGNTAVSSNQDLSLYLSIPIQGWGSNMALSSDAGSGRPVVGVYTGHTGITFTANVTTFKFNTLAKDSHNCYNPLTGVVTIPEAGDYVFSISNLGTGIGAGGFMYVYKNGVILPGIVMGYLTPGQTENVGTVINDLKTGDTIDFRSPNTPTTGTDTNITFSFFKINSGSQILARDEDVFVEAYCATNRTINSSTDLRWDTITKDTHGAMNTTTGVFTAPKSGFYSFKGHISPTGVINGYTRIYKNGSHYKSLNFLHSAYSSPGFAGDIYLLLGETLSIRSSNSFTASGGSLAGDTTSNITIKG